MAQKEPQKKPKQKRVVGICETCGLRASLRSLLDLRNPVGQTHLAAQRVTLPKYTSRFVG
jgi:hypothetical protein